MNWNYWTRWMKVEEYLPIWEKYKGRCCYDIAPCIDVVQTSYFTSIPWRNVLAMMGVV